MSDAADDANAILNDAIDQKLAEAPDHLVPILDNNGRPTGEFYAYASAMKPATPMVDPKLATTLTPFVWSETDGSTHDGSEYHFPCETGLPYLRTEWVARTDGLSYGLGILFMATRHPETGGGPSDYSDWSDATEHPDNEDHYRTSLFEPWNLLFPDKSEVWVLNGTTIVDKDTPEAVRVTVDDAIIESIRRYRENLKNIHKSSTDQALESVNSNGEALRVMAQDHLELVALAQNAIPDLVVSDMTSIQQIASEPAPLVSMPVELEPGPIVEGPSNG